MSLSTAGFLATAISYGPGRMGFGLFAPEFRSAFSLSTASVGLISSLGFLGFLLALILAQTLLERRGPEAPVLLGLTAATLGFGIVAVAPNPVVLAAGVFAAASSAGFAWTPFNDAVHRKIHDADRPTILSRISTGTSVGIAAAGLAALTIILTGLSWRFCWAIFAVASAAALVVNRGALRPVEKAPAASAEKAWSGLLHVAALPMFAIAFVYGATSAVYMAFAADHIRQAGGVPGAPAELSPAFVFVAYGVFGLTGLLTGCAKGLLGLARLLRLLMLAGASSAAFAAILPSNWLGLVSSAGLQGVHVMMTSAVLAFWSERLFPSRPARGFTAALLAAAAGNVLGPAVAGVVADAHGARAMLIGVAAPPALTALLLRERHVWERAASAH